MIRCTVCPQPYTTTGRCEFFLVFDYTFNLWTSLQILLASYGHKLHCVPGLTIPLGDAIFFFWSLTIPSIFGLRDASSRLAYDSLHCVPGLTLPPGDANHFLVFDLRSLTIPSIFGPRDASSRLAYDSLHYIPGLTLLSGDAIFFWFLTSGL